MSSDNRWPIEDNWTLENILYDLAEEYFKHLPDGALSEDDYDTVEETLVEFIHTSRRWQDDQGRK